MDSNGMDRRALIGAGLGLAATLGDGHAWAAAEPVVETTEGRARGRTLDGVTVFKGLNYGADTAGEGRFMPPRPPARWTGVRDAFGYGDQSPQLRTPLADAGPMSEDCLRINVWTPAIDTRKRPVMVWFHGGGFEAGSASSPLYDGAHLARRGDVVVASINHRLNVFGHGFLGQTLGEDFAASGNVGYLDLVAALKWVKANIAAFGGDPGNVTIFGQSGGGRKVSLCYAGAASKGLFHKGIVQSGAHLRIQSPDEAQALTRALLEELSIAPADARRLQTVPADQLTQAQFKVVRKLKYRFSPVLDGTTFQTHPFLPNAPRISSHLPIMLGTTRTELSNQLSSTPGVFDLDEAGMVEKLKTYLPEADIAEAVSTFRASRPQASPSELFFTIASARGYVRDQTIMAEQRVKAGGKAPTYVYQLMWRSPAEGGRRVTEHALDIPFVFDNVVAGARLTGPETAETRAMTEAMSGAWLAFARSGDPNHAGLPSWRPYDLRRRSTLMFDVPSTAVDDPHKAERLFMGRYETQQIVARTLTA